VDIRVYILQEAGQPLHYHIMALRHDIAKAVQKIYDEWVQNEESHNDIYGSGGICDEVSSAISGVLSKHIHGIEFTDGGQEGSDHAYPIVYNKDEAYAVDVPPDVYEIGSGYSWKKRHNVTIHPNNIVIYPVSMEDIQESCLQEMGRPIKKRYRRVERVRRHRLYKKKRSQLLRKKRIYKKTTAYRKWKVGFKRRTARKSYRPIKRYY
jgi:hypothetical protein